MTEGQVFVLAGFNTSGTAGTFFRVKGNLAVFDFQRGKRTGSGAFFIFTVTVAGFPDKRVFIRMKQTIQLVLFVFA